MRELKYCYGLGYTNISSYQSINQSNQIKSNQIITVLFHYRYAVMSQHISEDITEVITENLTFTIDVGTGSER